MSQSIKIGHDELTFTPGLECHAYMLASQLMHQGHKITWPAGHTEWYETVGTQLWLITRWQDGRTDRRQVR